MGADHLQARVLDVSPLILNAASPQQFGPSRYETVTYEVTNPLPHQTVFMPRLQELISDHKNYLPDRDATIAIGQTLSPQIISSTTTVRYKIAFAIPKTANDVQVGLVNTEGTRWLVDTR